MRTTVIALAAAAGVAVVLWASRVAPDSVADRTLPTSSKEGEPAAAESVVAAALSQTVGVMVTRSTTSCAPPAAPRTTAEPLEQDDASDVVRLIERYWPEDFATVGAPAPSDYGAGVVAGPNVVLTSGRLVKGAVKVELALMSGERISAHVSAIDERTGVAILRADSALGAPALRLADRPSVGARLLIVGSPLRLSHSLMFCSVAAARRGVFEVPDVAVIQTDATAMVGYEGGPAYSQCGELIGIALDSPVTLAEALAAASLRSELALGATAPGVVFVIPVKNVWNRILHLIRDETKEEAQQK